MPGGMMIPAGRNMPAAGRIGGLASYAASLGQVTHGNPRHLARAIIPTTSLYANSCSVSVLLFMFYFSSMNLCSHQCQDFLNPTSLSLVIVGEIEWFMPILKMNSSTRRIYL